MANRNLSDEIEVLASRRNFRAVAANSQTKQFSTTDQHCILIDLGICSDSSLQYIDYTQHQNALMSKWQKLFRFAVEDQQDLDQLGSLLDGFLGSEEDSERLRRYGKTRAEDAIDPTLPEAEFEAIFQNAFGENGLYALHREYPFPDCAGRIRYVDYVLHTKAGKIAIELNGESFHHPYCIGKTKYQSQLFKQNSLVAAGFKVFRWSFRGMQDQERFIEEMRFFFGSPEGFSAVPTYMAPRNLRVFRLMNHQEDVISRLEKERNAGRNAFLVVLPTGTGKTEVLMEDFRRIKERTPTASGLLLVPTRELKRQSLDKLNQRLPSWVHSESSLGNTPGSGFTVQTYQQIIRHYDDHLPESFSYIAVDEAHHAVAPGLRRALEHFSPSNLIGLTATDERLDEKKLEEVFGSYETSLSLQEAIKSGLLPPVRAFRVETNIDLSNVRYNGKDYVQSDLQRALIVPSRDQIVADVIRRYFGRDNLTKQGVVFCVDLKHTRRMAERLCAAGIDAEPVSGEDRKASEEAIGRYHRGRIRFLCACNLLTEGWDAPQTSVLVMARPTMSKVLYVQQLGRGTRSHPGKEALYVIDVVDRYGALNAPWSVHAVFGADRYEPWANLTVGAEHVGQESERQILLRGMHEEERRVSEIDIFTFQRRYENYLNEEQLARELFVSTGTVESWIKKGEISPDVTVPFGARSLRFFAPERVHEIRAQKELKVHDQTTQYEDFFDFLEARDYTFSFKMVFLLSMLSHCNRRGEADTEDLLKAYRGFFADRMAQGTAVEKPSSPYNRKAYLDDADQVTRSMLSNPFEKFERKRFMHHCKDLKYIAFATALWNRLSQNPADTDRIHNQMIQDLQNYFKELGGLGDLGRLVQLFPKTAHHLRRPLEEPVEIVRPFIRAAERGQYPKSVPFVPLHVAAGSFEERIYEEVDSFVDLQGISNRSILPGMFVTQVTGKSMEPTVPEGSYCLFYREVHGTRQNKILLIRKVGLYDLETGADYTLKRYRSRKVVGSDEQWRHSEIELNPDNPEFPVLRFVEEDAETLEVIGEMIEVLKIR